MREEKVIYEVGGVTFHGYMVYDPTQSGRRPTIIIGHAWRGQDEFAREKAREIAKLGYVGFAADVFGEGKTASTDEEAYKLITPLFIDRKLLRERILGAYKAALTKEVVDPHRMGAMGFCFGGLTVIELMRTGFSLRGIVSFHGLLGDALGDLKAVTEPRAKQVLGGSILLLHGYEDPMVSQQDITHIQKELTDAKVDWQMNIYGQTTHAFTNPQAHEPAKGMAYNPKTAARAWVSARNFFEEVFK